MQNRQNDSITNYKQNLALAIITEGLIIVLLTLAMHYTYCAHFVIEVVHCQVCSCMQKIYS